jgi:hypothetical protein
MSYLRNEDYTGWVLYGSSIIYPQGNVGIGKNNPVYSLDVVGDINLTGTFRQNGTPLVSSQWTTSGTAIYYTTGNVGIGTATNLTNALNVNGTVSATSFSGAGTGLTGTASSLTAGSAAALSTNFTTNYVLFGQGTGVPNYSSLLTWDGSTLRATDTGTSAGIYGKRFYAAAVGDNTDTPSTTDNAGGPWYGLGYSVDTGLTAYVQLAGYSGLSLKTATGITVMDNSGRIGIGTVSPATALDINTTTGINVYSTATTTPLFKMVTFGNNNSSTFWSEDWDGTAGGPNGSMFTMDHSTGQGLYNLLAGGYNDANTFKYGSTRGACRISMGDATFGVLLSSLGASGGQTRGSPMTLYNSITSDTSTVILYTNAGTERMRVDSSGRIGIGTASPARKLHVYDAATSGSGPFVVDQFATTGFTDTVTLFRTAQIATSGLNMCIMQANSGSDNLFYVRGDGYVWAKNDITAFSDERVKTNLQKIEGALDKVSNINGYTFTRTDYTNETDKNKRHVGVIAQEIQRVIPELVHENDKGMLSVAYGNMTALLIEALKEERQKREALEKRLERLEKILFKE